jgi:P27 family predicted phage terminase small subunit
MKRGPKAKPTALQVFAGDPGKRLAKRDGEVQPLAAFEVPEPPTWLGAHGQAKWRDVAPVLLPVNLLTRQDFDALAVYCEAWDEFMWALEEIAKEGRIATSEKGGAYQHPAVGIKNKAIQRIRQIGACFGMTPSDRIGLKVEPAKRSGLAAFKAR